VELRGVIVVEDAGTPAPGPRARGGALELVANRPIVEHVLDGLESAGVEDVVVASSDELADEIRCCLGSVRRRTGGQIRFVTQPAPLDVEGALRLAAPMIGETRCIVHLASGLLGEPLAPLLRGLDSDSPNVALFVHQATAPDERLGAATRELLHIAELYPERAALGMAGVWLFGPGAINHARAVSWHTQGELDMTPVARRIAAQGGALSSRLAEAWRRYAGDPADLLELNKIALDGLEPDDPRPRTHGNRIEGRVQIDERASVRASVIVGPAVIGPAARIADSYIGPYTSIGQGARIEGAEIERSIIAAGASVMHIGGRLSGSVVGRDARIFRDFSLPRALRLRVGDGTEVALC
jgi:glucose-1-phosphate thymidylyltransferase